MNISKTDIEDACMFLLQKKVSFEINNKAIKQGKVLLFYQKNFYITLILETAKKSNEKFEIPIPYKVETHKSDNLVFFDYRIQTLSKNCPEIEPFIRKKFSKKNSNKFWNAILTIDCKL